MFVDRLNSREAMTAAPPDEEAARAMLLVLIAEEEERLDGILAGHLEREEAEATAELAFDATADGERLRRYESDNDRKLLRIIETLKKRRQTAEDASPPPPPVVESPAARAEPAPPDATTEAPAEGSTPAWMEPCPHEDGEVASSESVHDPSETLPIGEPGEDGNGTVAAESSDPAELVRRLAPAILAAMLGLFALLGFIPFLAAFVAGREVAPPRHAAQTERVRTEFRPRDIHRASPMGDARSLSVPPGRQLGGLTVRPPVA